MLRRQTSGGKGLLACRTLLQSLHVGGQIGHAVVDHAETATHDAGVSELDVGCAEIAGQILLAFEGFVDRCERFAEQLLRLVQSILILSLRYFLAVLLGKGAASPRGPHQCLAAGLSRRCAAG